MLAVCSYHNENHLVRIKMVTGSLVLRLLRNVNMCILREPGIFSHVTMM